MEGTFARLFRSGIRPIEIGRRLVREMDDQRSLDVRGRTIVPNHYVVELAAADHEQYQEITDSLQRELADAAREHARTEGYTFMGPVQVVLEPSPDRGPGSFEIRAHLREGSGGLGAGSLVLPTGERVPLGESTVSFGRRPECTVQLADPNVSRNHAEIRPRGTGWVLLDLGSTNGTRVNGSRVRSHELADGDEITFGSTNVVFEAS